MKNINKQIVDLPDGEYYALWSGSNMEIIILNGENVFLETTISVKGIDCEVGINISDGLVNIIPEIKEHPPQFKKKITEMKNKETYEIDKSKLTFHGSMNYIVQIFSDDESGTAKVDQYQPRRNVVCTQEFSKEELEPQVEETIERMKIAITHLQEYLEGKRDVVYYWQLENEEYD